MYPVTACVYFVYSNTKSIYAKTLTNLQVTLEMLIKQTFDNSLLSMDRENCTSRKPPLYRPKLINGIRSR